MFKTGDLLSFLMLLFIVVHALFPDQPEARYVPQRRVEPAANRLLGVFSVMDRVFFKTERKKLSQFGHNVRKYRLVNNVRRNFNSCVGQMTEMSQREKTPACGSVRLLAFCLVVTCAVRALDRPLRGFMWTEKGSF